MSRIAGRFARVEPRLRAKRLVPGLLSDLPRKNCWTIAEWAGEATPHGMQHLLCRGSPSRCWPMLSSLSSTPTNTHTGLLHDQVTAGLCSQSCGWGHGGLVLDGGQSA
ncbi:hypothetical protein ACI2LW_33730, partial [Streptomyces sp. NPDC004065]